MWKTVFDMLPDVSGILLAAVGVALVVAPDFLSVMKKWVRWTLAALLAALGVAGMVSSYVQHRDESRGKVKLEGDLIDVQSKMADLSKNLFSRPTQDKPVKVPVANVKQEPITVAAKLYDPKSLSIEVENLSEHVAQGVTWELVLFRASDQAIFSFATQSIGYVKPHSKSAFYSMNLENIPKAPTPMSGDGQMRIGDVFIGSLALDCPDCKGTSYIVHLVWGDGGWIYKIIGANGGLAFPKDSSKSGISQFTGWLEAAATPADRIPIMTR
jgi:hypothetical protein